MTGDGREGRWELPGVEDVVDIQVHIWETDRPSRSWIDDPWVGRSDHAREVFRHQLALSCTGETVLDELAVVGVRKAVLAPLGVYGFDNSIELAAARRHPDQLVALASIDHRAANVGQRLTTLLADGFRGIRFAPMDWAGLGRGDYEEFFKAAAQKDCPVFLNLVHPLPEQFLATVRRFRSIPFVIDHVGLGSAPPVQPAGADPFEHLATVLELAAEPNMWLKLSSLPAVSRGPFPFPDVWDVVRQVVDAFSPERVAWGSDFTRTNCLYSYREGLEYLWHVDGLDVEARKCVTGRTARRLLGIEP